MEDMKFSEKFGVVDEGLFMESRGKFVSVFHPEREDVNIDVIAHSLSNLCRFNGHTRSFYSVAQHSVLVSRAVPDEFRLHALLHDASEAFLGDIIRPLKILGPMELYRDLEKMWQRFIFECFGLHPEMPDAVKEADNRVLLTEFRDLFPETPGEILEWGIAPLDGEIYPWDPDWAKRAFKVRFEFLTAA